MADDCNPQFDSYLGGCEEVPRIMNLSEFFKNRMEEVVMLTETIKESPFRGLTFQRIPKHMRRRQMSHYIKRLPKRLQRPYLMSLKNGLPTSTKRPSRKFRRRPANLLTEYNRRQKKHIWLETHIWHAKRFHMIKKWGYKLPEKPVNKSFRACYRAVSEHCLLTDNSYYNCIELKGPEIKLLEGLKQCCSVECGLTFGAKMYVNGSREGRIFLFHPNSYPCRVIGNVSFMWKPVSCDENERQIWIWTHPLMHDEIVQCFKSLFELIEDNETINDIGNSPNMGDQESTKEEQDPNKGKLRKRKKWKKASQKSEQIKLIPKNIPFTRVPKFKNKDGSVVMSLLKYTLNRFQLTGPLSQAIISQMFNIASVNCDITEKDLDLEIVEIECKKPKLDAEIILDESVEPKKNWWVQYYKSSIYKKYWENQTEFYKKLAHCSKPSDVSSNMILSLVVEDPRLNLPPKREKAVSEIKEFYQMPSGSIDNSLCQSPIWNPEIRDEVSMTKLSTFEINEAKSKLIVPGFDVRGIIPNEKQARIPILLVQRPGQEESHSGKLGLGSGWDIITPAGFGMPIWQSLILRGARTGGLRESEYIQLECSNLDHCLQPDSVSGEIENKAKFQELKTRYFKLPPSKRANYIKLGVLSPFYCPWKILVKDWSAEKSEKEKQEEFCVLRNKKILSELNEAFKKLPKCQGLDLNNFLKFDENYLIPVRINCKGKGNPLNFSLICLPEEKDFVKGATAPLEPPHADKNENLRKVLKTEHRKLLKSLRRKRKKDRSKLKEDFVNNVEKKLKWKDILKSNTAPSKHHSEKYNEKMKSLWIPEVEQIESIKNHCSRKVIGFIVKGGFCFSSAVGSALGYVSLYGLVELLRVCKRNKSNSLVLVRNKNHLQYRFGNLKVVVQ